MSNLLSALIQGYAKKNGVTGSYQFGRRYGFKTSTASDWWHGKSLPNRKTDRAKLFQLIPHEIFAGPATREKKKQALASLEAGSEEFALSKTDSTQQAVERFAHLASAMLPDLRALINADAETRRLAKQVLGDERFMALYTGIRAISSDATFQSLADDGMLDSLKGGG